MTAINEDLNKVITGAVQARIEAMVLAAVSSDDTFAQFVTAALQQKVEVRGEYRQEKPTFLAHTLEKAIQDATKTAVAKVVGEMAPELEAEVAKALRRDIKGIAAALVASVDKAASSPYGVQITLQERGDQ